MLHRCVRAKFLIKHGKFREHASKIYDKTSLQHAKFSKTSKIFTKLYKKCWRISEKHYITSQTIPRILQKFPRKIQKAILTFTIEIDWPFRWSELALTICEPIHKLSDPEKLSNRIIGQLLFSEDTFFTEQYTSTFSLRQMKKNCPRLTFLVVIIKKSMKWMNYNHNSISDSL